jgi:hypothetical protein
MKRFFFHFPSHITYLSRSCCKCCPSLKDFIAMCICYHFNTLLLIKVENRIFCFHILHWATESEKYIILTLFYDQNYVNLSNLKFHPLSHKVFIFLKITQLSTNPPQKPLIEINPTWTRMVSRWAVCNWLVLLLYFMSKWA